MWYVWRFSMFNNSSDFKKKPKVVLRFRNLLNFLRALHNSKHIFLYLFQCVKFFSPLNTFYYYSFFFFSVLLKISENMLQFICQTILPPYFIQYSWNSLHFYIRYSFYFYFSFRLSADGVCYFLFFLRLYEYLLRFQQKKNRILLYSRTFIFIQFLFIYFHSAVFCRVVDVKLYCYGFRCKTNFWQHFNIK